MDKVKFLYIFLVGILLFFLLTFVYYDRVHTNTIDNAKAKINDMLLNYKALRTYVSNVQKQEVYRLQNLGIIDHEYFNPKLLSSTYSAKTVNKYYNEFRKDLGYGLINIRFASDNPRNPLNKATQKESELLKRFNTKEITEYTEIIEKNGKKILYYVVPTKPTEEKCMRCHSTPNVAPKGLIKMYGDQSGFYEKSGDIRALLSTSYSLDADIKRANNIFWVLTIVTFIVFIVLGFIVYFFIKRLNLTNKILDKKVQQRTKELEYEKEYIQTILDINPSILFVVNSGEIINANKQFFRFFQCKNLKELKQRVDCVCEYFIEFDGKPFPKDKKIDAKEWCDYLVGTKDQTHHVMIKFDDLLSSFNISAAYLNQRKDILVTLHDITEQKKKDQMIFEQSKLASMSEMIDNIAHQWRQPLSIIATSATGMQMKKEHQILGDDEFHDSCEIINENAQYLSHTIDEFRKFIKDDNEQRKFYLKKTVENMLDLLKNSIHFNKIRIELDIDKDIEIFGYPNELVQVLISLYNNSKDAFIKTAVEDRIIVISSKIISDHVELVFQDNGGGIERVIIDKVFEPYFTTKHKSQGTGMGLHMSYNLVVECMDGKILVENSTFEYYGKKYSGAQFTITLPL